MPKKRCSNCEKIKSNNNFFNDKRGKFGIESICKRCRMDKNNENRAKNREKYNQYQNEWKIKNNWKDYSHRYYIKNKEKIFEKQKTDPFYLEKKNVRWHKRKARLLGNSGNHTVKEWQDLKKKHKNKCAICGKKKKLTKDHIISLDNGGVNDIENIQPLCQSCNSIKGSSSS